MKELRTPALILDKARLQANLDRMAERACKLKVNLRPHKKTAKSIEVARLATQGLRLPALGDDDETADRQYVRLFGLQEFAGLGQHYGFDYGEAFYYISPRSTFIGGVEAADVENYISANAVALQ